MKQENGREMIETNGIRTEGCFRLGGSTTRREEVRRSPILSIKLSVSEQQEETDVDQRENNDRWKQTKIKNGNIQGLVSSAMHRNQRLIQPKLDRIHVAVIHHTVYYIKH